MRTLFGLAVLCALLSLPAALSAQQLNVYPVATGFSGQGKVLELELPQNADALPLYIVWRTADGQRAVLVRARAGRHTYEMRNRPHWEEPVVGIGVTLRPVSAGVKEPTLFDELDMFLQPAQVTPSTVNLLDGHLLLGWRENIFLMMLAALAGIGFCAFTKTTAAQSTVLGFLVAWGVLSLHGVYDQLTAARTMSKGNLGIFSVADLNDFADHASGLIGAEAWNDDVQGLGHDFLHYDLAEHGYAPANSGRTAEFRITQNPNGNPILWEHAGYFLMKNVQH